MPTALYTVCTHTRVCELCSCAGRKGVTDFKDVPDSSSALCVVAVQTSQVKLAWGRYCCDGK